MTGAAAETERSVRAVDCRLLRTTDRNLRSAWSAGPADAGRPCQARAMGRTVYRGAALADGAGPELRRDVSVLVEDDRIVSIGPAGDEPDPGDAEVIDCSGTTIVPGLVDSHSHLTMPGGAHWVDRGFDSPQRLVEVAEHNARLQRAAGVRWARDVGSPVGADPVDGRVRGVALGVRDRWAGRREYPYVRAAGTWISQQGSLP